MEEMQEVKSTLGALAAFGERGKGGADKGKGKGGVMSLLGDTGPKVGRGVDCGRHRERIPTLYYEVIVISLSLRRKHYKI